MSDATYAIHRTVLGACISCHMEGDVMPEGGRIMPDKMHDCDVDGHEWVLQDRKNDRTILCGQDLVTHEEVSRCRLCEAIKRVHIARPVGGTKLRHWYEMLWSQRDGEDA